MKSLLLTTVFLILTNSVLAQERNWDVVSGVGLPDLMHIGINTNITKGSSVGINIGFISASSKMSQFTIEHKLHLKYSRKFTNQPTWYFGQRVTYFYKDDDEVKWETLYLTPNIGKHLNISNTFGLNADIGAFIQLWQKIKREQYCFDCESDVRFFVLPSARIQLFYKF